MSTDEFLARANAAVEKGVSLQDHQNEFIKLLSQVFVLIQEHMKSNGAIEKCDLSNLRILHTSLMFIGDTIGLVYADHDKVIGVERPDLVRHLDYLTFALESMFDVENKKVALTLAIDVMNATENFNFHYYNSPRFTKAQSWHSRLLEKLMLMMRGVKG